MTESPPGTPRPAHVTVRRFSLLFLLQGALLVLAGVFAILSPFFAVAMLTLILGWTLLFTGVVQAITLLFSRGEHFWPQLISAVLAFLLGLLIVRDPAVAIVSLVLLFVVFFMVEGIAKVVFALTVYPLDNWFWVLLSGVVAVVLSIWLFANPAMSAFALGIFIGIQFIAEGVAICSIAWSARKAAS